MRHPESSTAVTPTNSRRSRPKATLLSGAAIAAVLAALLGTQPGLAGSSGASDAQSQIEDLPVCYARGTDTIGRAVNAPAGTDLDSTAALVDPTFTAGLEFFRRCFAPNFSFTLSNNGTAGRTVPDPATRTPKTDAALQWANFVNNAFRGPAYVATQHHMGSISSEVHGDKADMKSYLIATHMFGPKSTRTGVSVVYGTYIDVAVRIKGTWLLEHRTLDTTASVPIAAPPQPGVRPAAAPR